MLVTLLLYKITKWKIASIGGAEGGGPVVAYFIDCLMLWDGQLFLKSTIQVYEE